MTWRRLIPAALLCAVALPATAQVGSRPAESGARRVPDGFSLLAAGDLLGPYDKPVDVEDAEVAKVSALIRSADAAFANQEGSSFDLPGFTGYKAAENGGGYPLQSTEAMRGFKAMGLDLVSRANNHGTDWGIEGMVASDRVLDAIGFTHAGTGASLAEARAPRYFASPRGRVALVATASTFTGNAPAGPAGEGYGPRPGISALHVQPVYLVTASEMKALKGIALRGGWQGYDLPTGDADAREVHIADTQYRVADAPGLTYDVSQTDRAQLIEAVRTARANADVVVFSIHAHETLSGGYEDPEPAAFLPDLFHAAIDAGADAVVRHGPHAVQGIEIYKGRPIFYGFGGLFFDLPRRLTIAGDGPNKQVVELPESWYETAVATAVYRGGAISEIRIHPLTIDQDAGPRRGHPVPATGAAASRILKVIQQRSARFGTHMVIRDGVGIVRGPFAS